ILLSGFVPTKQTSSEAPVPGQATGVKITRESTGVFLTECDNQPYGTYYGCILTAGQPLPAGIHISEKGQIRFLDQNQEPSNGGTAAPSLMLFGGGILDINAKRKKRFVGLTLGVIYYAVYYVGNAQGVGGLSDPVSLHCS
nr:hypothetical protein [Flavobacteriales bacterium]